MTNLSPVNGRLSRHCWSGLVWNIVLFVCFCPGPRHKTHVSASPNKGSSRAPLPNQFPYSRQCPAEAQKYHENWLNLISWQFMKLNFAFLSNGLLNDAVYERTEPLLVQTYMHTQLCTYIHIEYSHHYIRVFTYSPHFYAHPTCLWVDVDIRRGHIKPYVAILQRVTSSHVSQT